MASRLGDRSATLMANHGMVAVGKNVDDALHSAVVVEHNAQIMWGAEALGGVVGAPREGPRLRRRLRQRAEQTWHSEPADQVADDLDLTTCRTSG